MKHTFVIYVEDKPGVLNALPHCFAGVPLTSNR